MKKFFIFIFIFILQINYNYTMIVKDNKILDKSGNSIDIKEYKRIVITDPAIVEIFYLLNGEDKIAAIANPTASKIEPHEKTKELKSIGTIRSPSIEAIVALEPDLVITFSGTNSIAPNLKAFNIPVITTSAGSIEEIYNNILACGYIVDKSDTANNVINQYKERIQKHRDAVKDKKKIRGVVLFSLSPMMTFSNKTLPGEILEILGVENLGDQKATDQTAVLSSEFLLIENPDFIAGTHGITDFEQMKSALSNISGTKAVKNGNLFFIDPQKMVRGSHRIFDVIDEIAKKLSELNLDDSKEEEKKE